MSTKLLELPDRTVTDRGEVILSYEALLRRARGGESLDGLLTHPHPDVDLYGLRSGRPLEVWRDQGDLEGPSPSTFGWNIPEEFQTLDVEELAVEMLVERGLTQDPYPERLAAELEQMRARDMFPFIRCLLYVVQTFRDNKVVWGVGRGSSCASLVLFVLGINKVDPVRYDIPMEEFLK